RFSHEHPTGTLIKLARPRLPTRGEPQTLYRLLTKPREHLLVQGATNAHPLEARFHKQRPHVAILAVTNRKTSHHPCDLAHPATSGGTDFPKHVCIGQSPRGKGVFLHSVSNAPDIVQVTRDSLAYHQ